MFWRALILIVLASSCTLDNATKEGKQLNKSSFPDSINCSQICIPMSREFDNDTILGLIGEDKDMFYPRAFAYRNNIVYILDAVNLAYMKVDLESGRIIGKSERKNRSLYFNDIRIFKDLVAITTVNGGVLLYSQDTIKVYKKISLAQGYIVSSNKNDFEVYFPGDNHKVFKLNSDLDILGNYSNQNMIKNTKPSYTVQNNLVRINEKLFHLTNLDYKGNLNGEINLNYYDSDSILIFSEIDTAAYVYKLNFGKL
ncbi:hypothetical protein [Carboxylicivirga taeanensis]|uniref:hypothetical protein n=1 Tax=Carboxylicivirga taeanensis TaxID=1416875 RepID=UPI003F6DD09F